MSKPLVVFGDAEALCRAYLADALADRSETYVAGVTVSTSFPTGGVDTASLPHLQVAWDGSPTVDYPTIEAATLRLTWWGDPDKRTDAKKAMSLVAGLLASHPGSDDIWNVRPLTGRLIDVDPVSGLLFVSTTFRVSLRPTQL